MSDREKLIETCKRRAKQIKRVYPDRSYMQRLDIAASDFGYRHFNALSRGEK